MPFTRTVQGQDSLGRAGTTTVRLDETARRVTIATPAPAGSYDWAELDELLAALQAARALLPGGRR